MTIRDRFSAEEWGRVAGTLHDMGVLTVVDRAGVAAYCQAYGRWVEAEEKLRETPTLFKSPAGYIQQSPWLGIANKQLELMGRFMVELGITPASRSRVSVAETAASTTLPTRIQLLGPDDTPSEDATLLISWKEPSM